jgi:hypothetical protein
LGEIFAEKYSGIPDGSVKRPLKRVPSGAIVPKSEKAALNNDRNLGRLCFINELPEKKKLKSY